MNKLATKACEHHEVKEAVTSSKAERWFVLLGAVITGVMVVRNYLSEQSVAVSDHNAAQEAASSLEWARVLWATLILLLAGYSIRQFVKANSQHISGLVVPLYLFLLAYCLSVAGGSGIGTVLATFLLPVSLILLLLFTKKLSILKRRAITLEESILNLTKGECDD